MNSNGFCDLVPDSPIGPTRLAQIEESLASASVLISRHWKASGLSGRLPFFAELMRVYRRGHCLTVGSAVVPPEDAEAMLAVKEVEGELLAGFSRMIQKAAHSSARAYGMDADDLQADAYEAFFRAMVNYSGKTRFSTYLWWALSRNLARLCKYRGELKVPRDVRKIAMRIVGAMRSERLTFDEAVESSGVSDSYRSKVVSSMSRVCSATDLDISPSEIASCTDRESLGWVREAVERANLGRLEKAVVSGFLDSPGDVMGLSEGCRGMVNPDTGRPYSRAALSAAWRQAKKKIARAMEAA